MPTSSNRRSLVVTQSTGSMVLGQIGGSVRGDGGPLDSLRDSPLDSPLDSPFKRRGCSLREHPCPSVGTMRGPSTTGRTGSLRRLRGQRALAAVGVAACLVANVWAVARAASDPGPSGAFTAMSQVSFDLGLQPVAGGPAKARTPGPSAPPEVVERGTGKLAPVDIPDGGLRSAADGREVRISIETEGGLKVDGRSFAAAVAATLSDPRGWQQVDRVRFVPVSPADVADGARVDLRIALASPETTDRLCAPLQTRGQVSCHNGGRAVINLRRWVLGVEAYGGDLAAYRHYVVNHEVGHGLGHGHESCAGPGKVAPVMMQQTYGLRGCTAWAWPAQKTA